LNQNELRSKDTYVTSAVFNEEALEITFLEARHQTPNRMRACTEVFAIDTPEKEAIFNEIQNSLCELLDMVEREARDAMNESQKKAPTAAYEHMVSQLTESINSVTESIASADEEEDRAYPLFDEGPQS